MLRKLKCLDRKLKTNDYRKFLYHFLVVFRPEPESVSDARGPCPCATTNDEMKAHREPFVAISSVNELITPSAADADRHYSFAQQQGGQCLAPIEHICPRSRVQFRSPGGWHDNDPESDRKQLTAEQK